MSADTIAPFKITLTMSSRGSPLRRGAVDIQARTGCTDHPSRHGWTNSHLYESAQTVWMGTPYADQMGRRLLDARKARLGDVLEDVGTEDAEYLYDFGDGWETHHQGER